MCWMGELPGGEHDTRRLQEAASRAVGPLTNAEASRILDWAVAWHRQGLSVEYLCVRLAIDGEAAAILRKATTVHA